MNMEEKEKMSNCIDIAKREIWYLNDNWLLSWVMEHVCD